MMADIEKLNIPGRRRRRGVIRSSITRLGDKISELETKEKLSPMEPLTVKRIQQRLGEANKEFKRFHFAIIDLLEQEEEIALEQANFSEHEDRL